MKNISEYKSISSKITREEFTLIESYCSKKDTTPSSLIRELLLKEIKVPVPHHIAGNNKINYNKEQDNFSWSVILDKGVKIDILKNISLDYMNDLDLNIKKALKSRNDSMKKRSSKSVAVPSNILKVKK